MYTIRVYHGGNMINEYDSPILPMRGDILMKSETEPFEVQTRIIAMSNNTRVSLFVTPVTFEAVASTLTTP